MVDPVKRQKVDPATSVDEIVERIIAWLECILPGCDHSKVSVGFYVISQGDGLELWPAAPRSSSDEQEFFETVWDIARQPDLEDVGIHAFIWLRPAGIDRWGDHLPVRLEILRPEVRLAGLRYVAGRLTPGERGSADRGRARTRWRAN